MHAFHRAAALASLLTIPAAQALPIGFGVNQGELIYSEIKSDNFYVYHDARVPTEGRAMLNALEAARPILERWFDVQLFTPVPVIMSAVSANASFANIVTNAIELQTLGAGSRDLAWHELVHTTMYRRVDNFLGPAGALLHVPWMPAWFIEGLAETLSVSIGSSSMAGIERYQALAGDWPSYDRLHSLYSDSHFAHRGYATSGAMTRYALTRGNPDRLPQMLDDFWWYTMPWWWPWSVVPFNDFLPMDAAFEEYAKVGGEELFAAYKRDAKAYWQRQPGKFLTADKGKRFRFTSLYGVASDGRSILHRVRSADQFYQVDVVFDSQTGWATKTKRRKKIERTSTTREPGLRIAMRSDAYSATSQIYWQDALLYERHGNVRNAQKVKDRIFWVERALAESKFCFADLPGRGKVSCPLAGRIPQGIQIIGRTGRGENTQLWLTIEEETSQGTRYRLVTVNSRGSPTAVRNDLLARPLKVAAAGSSLWLLSAERQYRKLRQIDAQANCQREIPLKDHILDIWGLADGQLVLGLYAGYRRTLRKINPTPLAAKCTPSSAHSSPLLAATRERGISLSAALAQSNLWAAAPSSSPSARKALTARPLDRETPPADVHPETASQPAEWRPRPVFLFPWIGADDALGSQVGVVSVPLMDHMQNETIRLTVLYGLASRFPNQDLSLTSTRFRTTLNLSLFRQQTWNGLLFDTETETVRSTYYDEKGGRLEAVRSIRALGGTLTTAAGFKYSHLKPYLGVKRVRHGYRAEPNLGFTLSHLIGRLSWTHSLRGRTAPESLNEEFDYNQVGASTTIGHPLPFLSSRFSLGLEGSRTRGKKLLARKEVYRPLKTFIPGSGGGYNKNSFAVAGDGSLFTARFGDTQARAKLNWTWPLIKDLDKLIWILYLERLDFSAFYNYGAAWRGDKPPQGWDRLVRAHGYSLDLQLENKGVRFNLGGGAGQVIGDDFQIYLTSGFDALF